MFNVGGGELLVILLMALIVLGPQRLPEAARHMGKFVGELRRMSSSFQRELRTALDEAEGTPDQAAQTARTAERGPSDDTSIGAAITTASEHADVPGATSAAPPHGDGDEPDARAAS